MSRPFPRILAVAVALAVGVDMAAAQATDPRLREVTYDARSVISVPVKPGVVTHILLDPDEAITDVASGLGSDCTKPEATWCVAAEPGGRNIFVKAKSDARAPNNLAVVTDRRTHSFAFVVLADGDARVPVYRLVVKAPVVRNVVAVASAPVEPEPSIPALPEPSPAEVIAERLRAGPAVVNTGYSIAEGTGSADIVPTLVFDDGRFTYFRFPGNREVPAVFHVLGDGSETLVNSRMEDDLLVVDRVSRRLMLRAGPAVVGVWNEAFDLDGSPPTNGTTVGGVERILKSEVDAASRRQSSPGAVR